MIMCVQIATTRAQPQARPLCHQVENDGNGNVKFVSRGGAPRLTASGAMRHPFVKRVRECWTPICSTLPTLGPPSPNLVFVLSVFLKLAALPRSLPC